MPKEQPCLREHSPCPPSSKNAKDKTNSTTLQALRDTKDAGDSYRRGSNCSSEKDSGYSDGSDWQQTDVEDQRRNRNQSKASENAETSQPGQNKELGPKNLENPTMTPAKLNHPPICILKDMVLKQPDIIQNRGQLLWTNGIRINNRSPHMILFEQPSFLPAAPPLHKPLCKTSNVKEKKTIGPYLPSLNTHPRIAPHPSKKPPDISALNREYQNLSKRVCTEHKAETPATKGLPEQHLHKQPKLAVSHSGPLCSSSASYSLTSCAPSTTSSVSESPSMSSLHTTSSFTTPFGLNKNITTGARHHRFLKTVDILRQSGLLDITLRTKELLRQSNATERDISQLRQHTELLCQAASNPNRSLSGTTAWEHLQRTMAESGSYPELQIQPKSESPSLVDLVSQSETIPTSNMNRPQVADSSEVPPSCLLASMLEQSHLKQGKKPEATDKSSDKVPFMSPDSSTG
ncbi:CLOCK-interacting pacemaker isoform 1-T2 [Odontesthes bonariensis]|uniref:CLOCK-interacting pacemaker n=1 Tax=Odontesthes bonariensis TaxID=219752 RepID=UPI003F58DE57